MGLVQNPNINFSVTFSQGQVPEILSRLERYLNIPLSLRSSTGETVIKTDYFYGPCSIIRATETGRVRCRKTYAGIEDKLFRRKVPFVSFCYCGFLVFAVPLEFRGEMIGTLIGSQILPMAFPNPKDLETNFGAVVPALNIQDKHSFFLSFFQLRYLKPDLERVSFLDFLEKIGENFIQMALAGKKWSAFLREMKTEYPMAEKFRFVDK